MFLYVSSSFRCERWWARHQADGSSLTPASPPRPVADSVAMVLGCSFPDVLPPTPPSTWRRESETSANVTQFTQSKPVSVLLDREKFVSTSQWQQKKSFPQSVG